MEHINNEISINSRNWMSQLTRIQWEQKDDGNPFVKGMDKNIELRSPSLHWRTQLTLMISNYSNFEVWFDQTLE